MRRIAVLFAVMTALSAVAPAAAPAATSGTGTCNTPDLPFNLPLRYLC